MDPRMYKLFGYKLNAPLEDTEDMGGTAGGDGMVVEESEDDEDETSEDDEEEDETVDEEESEDDEDETSEDDEEDENADGELGKFGQRAQKRIKGLVAKTKDLERQLEEAKKLGGDDGEAIISAATKAGIMPSLMTKELAEGLKDLQRSKNARDYFNELLDRDEDEYEIGEKTYTRRQIERKERALGEEIRELERRFGKGRDKALDEAKALFELGLAAKKAGWKPGTDKKTKTKKHDKPEMPASQKKIAKKGSVNAETVETDDDLEAFIAEQRRRKD